MLGLLRVLIVAVTHRIVIPAVLYGYRKLAARRNLACKNLGKGRSPFLARIPCHKYRPDIFRPSAKIHSPAGVHHYSHIPV